MNSIEEDSCPEAFALLMDDLGMRVGEGKNGRSTLEMVRDDGAGNGKAISLVLHTEPGDDEGFVAAEVYMLIGGERLLHEMHLIRAITMTVYIWAKWIMSSDGALSIPGVAVMTAQLLEAESRPLAPWGQA